MFNKGNLYVSFEEVVFVVVGFMFFVLYLMFGVGEIESRLGGDLGF